MRLATMNIVLCMLVLAGCGGGAPTAAATPAHAGNFGFTEAVDAAMARHPNGVPFEVELETHQGRELVEVELFDGTDARELFFEPGTGTFVSEEAETPDEPEEAATLPALREQLAAGNTNLRAALHLAFEHYEAARVREVELEIHDGHVILEVKVRDANGDTEYVHDPATGALMGRENESTHEVVPAG